MSRAPEISVVIPMRNESASVAELYRELTTVLEGFGRPYEILVIDDGSTDDTFAKLAALQSADQRLRVIQFRRNFGQTAAFAAGFAHARGRFIVTSDGDLQNDPRDIPGMIEMAERGPDIVAGWRKDRKDPFINRRLPSIIANAIISMSTGVKLHDYGCSLKVFRAEVVKPMKLYGEMHRFLPAIASEFLATSISSGGTGNARHPDELDALRNNPNMRMINNQRGYHLHTIAPDRWETQVKVIDQVDRPGGSIATLATFRVDPRRPGPELA